MLLEEADKDQQQDEFVLLRQEARHRTILHVEIGRQDNLSFFRQRYFIEGVMSAGIKG